MRGGSGYIDMDGQLTGALMGVVLIIGLIIALTRHDGLLWSIAAGVATTVAGLTVWMDEPDIASGAGSMPAANVDTAWGIWLVGAASATAALVVATDITLRKISRRRSRARSSADDQATQVGAWNAPRYSAR